MASYQPLPTMDPGDDDREPGDWDDAGEEARTERLRLSAHCGHSLRHAQAMSPSCGWGAFRDRPASMALGMLTGLAAGITVMVGYNSGAHSAQGSAGLRARAVTEDVAVKEAAMLVPNSVSLDFCLQSSRTGCENWDNIQIGEPKTMGSQNRCAEFCRSTDGCTQFNFQPMECQGVSQIGRGACVLFKGDCIPDQNFCFDLYAMSTGPDVCKEPAQVSDEPCACGCCPCGCEGGATTPMCVTLDCPTAYIAKPGSSTIQCAGTPCTQEEDLETCCSKRATCDTLVCEAGFTSRPEEGHLLCGGSTCIAEDNLVCCVHRATCDSCECPEGSAMVSHPDSVMCAESECGNVDVDTCCLDKNEPENTLKPPIDPEQTVSTTKEVIIDIEEETPEDVIMRCDLNCFHEGISVDLPSDKVGDIDSCRKACLDTTDCSGVVYKKDFEETGESICHGKKDLYTALCQPARSYYTEILRHRPWGKCALLGDPHILQFDRLPQLALPTYDIYNAGDYILVDSKELQIHSRFAFTERFPTATSTAGVAVGGSLIKDKKLVAVYIKKLEGFRVFWDGKRILEKKPDSFSDGTLVAEYDDMDPTKFESDALHTIGLGADKLPVFTFAMKDVPLKIYCLLGTDNMNLVIEMEKLEYPMDGLCGNFNCNPADDDLKHLSLESRDVAQALDWKSSLFAGPADVEEAPFEKGDVDNEEVLGSCDKGLLEKGRQACGNVDEGQATACLVDVCVSGTVDAAAADVMAVGLEVEIEDDIERHI